MTAAGRTAAGAGVVTGNTFDKYGSSNPVVRRLMDGFESTLDELFARADPESVLDIGCGEGVLTELWAQRLAPRRVVGIDLDDPKLRAEWERRPAPNLEFRALSAEPLPFAKGRSSSCSHRVTFDAHRMLVRIVDAHDFISALALGCRSSAWRRLVNHGF